MKIDATLEIDTTHGSIDVNIITEDTAVIGHRGEVLDALQILTKRAAEEGEDKFVRVNVDSKNYRVKRETSLVALAEKMAAKCIRTGRKVVLEPMSNTHRKVIHATLSSNNKVITKSEGREPNRRVIIIPKRYDKKRNDNNNN
jgi:spoIIIJ-associated protein